MQGQVGRIVPLALALEVLTALRAAPLSVDSVLVQGLLLLLVNVNLVMEPLHFRAQDLRSFCAMGGGTR